MNWLEKLRKRLGYEDPVLDIPDQKEVQETQAILQSAKIAYAQSQTLTAEVHLITKSLASLRARNHFGESIQLAMMPRGNRG